jgi:hypothetical protein
MRLRRSPVIALATLTLLHPCPVEAQATVPQLTPAQLARPMIVTRDGSPDVVRGRIVRMDADVITVAVAGVGGLKGATVDVPFAEVARIEPAPDSLANGTLIGALVFGIWCAKVCGQGADNRRQAEFARFMGFGLGALIGAGIDARTGRKPPVYVRAPGRSAHIGFSVRF